MILFPDVQAKAQEEIDRVVGTDRLPTHGRQLHLLSLCFVRLTFCNQMTEPPCPILMHS